MIIIFFKDFNYKNEGDYLYPVEYYQFRQASTHNTFKVELLCFDDRGVCVAMEQNYATSISGHYSCIKKGRFFNAENLPL
ncbi:hypothetical protein ACQKIW_30335 [Bacillus thuringiensis]|uniref:hypothetical protein n=1 Tax=Bacillus thuringiensis TaxID=1428 RepID=UPI003D07AA98